MSIDIEKTAVPSIIDPVEFAAAQQKAKNSSGIFTHEFRVPFSYEGKTYVRMSFNFEKLTGNDGLAIENEMLANGKLVVAPTFSGDYLIRMAARACEEKIGHDIILATPLSDYNRIRNMARSFLLKSES